MSKLYNLARMTTSTTGTGTTISLGSAVPGFITFGNAGVPDGERVSVGFRDGSSSQIGTATYNTSGPSLTDLVVSHSTNSNSPINLSGAAEVFITARAQDIATIPNCGRFTYVSATAVKFAPFNGDQIKINGGICSIPVAGIAGGANTGVYVEGVAGQNLAASTLYYVYAFNNAGTITMDFSITGHETSDTPGNVGVETKIGDDTRSLIGMVDTNGSSQFLDSLQFRYVISWFNRRNIVLRAAFTAARSTASTSYIELNSEIRNYFLTWGEDAVQVSVVGAHYVDTANREAHTSLGFDGTTAEDVYTAEQAYVGGARSSLCLAYYKSGLSEGAHYVTVLGKATTPGTATWDGITDRQTRLSTLIRG